MNIRNRRAVHETAQRALNRAARPGNIILVYGLICCILSLASTVVSALLSDRISGTGGLGNIGLRSILSTGQSVLPLFNLIVTACLGMGYHTAILSITRGFEASPRTLLSGFRHFGPVIRTLLFQSIIYAGAGVAAMYLSSFIFMATPFSAAFLEVMEPVLASATVMDTTLVLDDAVLAAATEALIPMMWILLGVCLLLMVPIYYRFRMVDFCLADDPRKGALYALSKSRKLLRRNCFALFRLDLSMWWFYGAQVLINLVCYGDVLLPLLGVTFPWSNTVSFYLFFLLSLGLQVALYYFGMNRVYAAYAVAYDALMEDFIQPEFPVQM